MLTGLKNPGTDGGFVFHTAGNQTTFQTESNFIDLKARTSSQSVVDDQAGDSGGVTTTT